MITRANCGILVLASLSACGTHRPSPRSPLDPEQNKDENPARSSPINDPSSTATPTPTLEPTAAKPACIPAEHHVCGPFSSELISQCLKFSTQDENGKIACHGPRWSKSFHAAMARAIVSTHKGMSIPYLCQHQNVNRPSATCGNTSLAMALSAVLNKSVTADFLWKHNAENFGYNMANSRDKFAQVAKSLGATGSRAAVLTAQGMKAELDAGRLIVLQGRFTDAFGHIILLVGYNARGFIAYDSNGSWNGGATGSGYALCGPTRSSGKGVVYSYGDIESQSLLGTDYSVGIISK